MANKKNKYELQYIFDGKFGLEKENLRVNTEGFLADTRHPFPDDPYIERDFCENQIELITRVCDSVDEVYEELQGLHGKVVRHLACLETGAEYLWPFSNPPYIRGEEDIMIAEYNGALKGKEHYRKYLAEKYGKKKMLLSGIHFNFSFSERFLQELYQEEQKTDFLEFKNQVYLRLAKQVVRYSWFLVYLTAASSVMDGSFFRREWLGMDMKKNYASARCSEIGYWNHFVPILSFENLSAYVDSVQEYVDQGQLKEISELYYPVRLKPAGENTLLNLRKNGVNHIELRMLDVNPLSQAGIMKEDLSFFHYFLIYLLFLEDIDFGILEQTEAISNEKKAALFEDEVYLELGWQKEEEISQEALSVLEDMEQFFIDFSNHEEIESIIAYQKEKIEDPSQRYATRVRKEFGKDYVKKGLSLAKEYARKDME